MTPVPVRSVCPGGGGGQGDGVHTPLVSAHPEAFRRGQPEEEEERRDGEGEREERVYLPLGGVRALAPQPEASLCEPQLSPDRPTDRPTDCRSKVPPLQRNFHRRAAQ